MIAGTFVEQILRSTKYPTEHRKYWRLGAWGWIQTSPYNSELSLCIKSVKVFLVQPIYLLYLIILNYMHIYNLEYCFWSPVMICRCKELSQIQPKLQNDVWVNRKNAMLLTKIKQCVFPMSVPKLLWFLSFRFWSLNYLCNKVWKCYFVRT